MATNEDLAVAFLCLCDKKDKDDILSIVDSHSKQWNDVENLERIRQSIELPISMIPRKIGLLHTGLHQCPFRKIIYEEMANRVANLSASYRSPLLKPRHEHKTSGITEHLMEINLHANK